MLVIGAADTQAGVKQAIVVPGGSTVQVAKVLATTIDDALHVLVVDTDGTVRDYSGWPLSEHQNYAISAGVMAAAVGDLSGDGQVELLVATADAIDAFDAVSGGPLWTSAISGIHALALAQLDADPALEIVTSTGAVIDAATRAIDWQYPDGFGNSIAAGHLLGNSSNQFVGGYSNYFITFRSTPWSPLWSAGKPYQIDHVLTADLDGNDRDVIITAARQGGGVDAWDSTTHQIRFSAPGFSWDVSALGVAALFPGQSKQLLIAGREWSGERTLRLLDTSTGSIPWSYTPWHGIFSPVAIADVDGDGKDEVVVAGSDPNGNAGAIAVFDADTGILEWQAADPGGYGNNAFFVSTAKILLVPHNTDAAMDVVLAGNSNYDGRITVFDGATHAVRLKIGEYATGPLGSRPITDAQLVDFDGNGVLDYVVSSPSISSNVSGALVQVFSGVDGQPLWSSDPIGTGFFPINNVLVTGPVSSATSEVIAVMPWYLQAFDLQTRSPTWALFVQSDAAAYVPNGIHGAEFLTFRNTGTVTFYDAETHTELRSFALDPPLLAVVAPAGDSRRLLAASNGALVLIDGLRVRSWRRAPSSAHNSACMTSWRPSRLAPASGRLHPEPISASSNIRSHSAKPSFSRVLKSCNKCPKSAGNKEK